MVSPKRIYLVLAIILLISCLSLAFVYFYFSPPQASNSDGSKFELDSNPSNREINEQEPNLPSSAGSSIRLPNPLRLLPASLRGGSHLNQAASDDSIQQQASKNQSIPIDPMDQLEDRLIYVIDLMDCDKTFALVKYKLWVRVPRKTPPFQQKPPLRQRLGPRNRPQAHFRPQNPAVAQEHQPNPMKNVATELPMQLQTAQPSNTRHSKRDSNSQTARAADQHDLDIALNTRIVPVEARGPGGHQVAVPERGGIRRFLDAISSFTHQIESQFQSVTRPASVAGSHEVETESPEVPSSPVAATRNSRSDTTTGELRVAGSSDHELPTGSLTEGGDVQTSEQEHELDEQDPVQDAASELKLSLSSIPPESDLIESASGDRKSEQDSSGRRQGVSASSLLNKTLVDCFLVDSEKRYLQKARIEEHFRSSARTRAVGWRSMNEIIEQCRLLSWSVAPERLTIVKFNGDGQSSNQTSSGGSSSNFPMVQSIAQNTNSFFENILTNVLSRMEPQLGSSSNERPAVQAAAAAGPATQQGSLLVQPTDDVGFRSQQLVLAPADGIGNWANTNATMMNGTTINGGSSSANNGANNRGLTNYVSAGMSMINGIVPNTLWCGLGDRANNYTELGTEYRVDSCCRAHDHCPIRLKPFTSDYGLMNWSISSRSHCECDQQFNNCLAQVNSTLANVLRVIYFRFVGLQCVDINSANQPALPFAPNQNT